MELNFVKTTIVQTFLNCKLRIVKKLKSVQIQEELKRHRAITLATIDYLISLNNGSIVFDDLDPVLEYYESQKIQIEKYYNQGRIDRLQQKLDNLIKILQNRIDLNFTEYIQKRTGYQIDIFDDLHKRVDAIIERGEIRNHKDLNDIGTIFQFYQKTSAEPERIDVLRQLILSYARQQPGKRKGAYKDLINEQDKKETDKIRDSSSTNQKEHLQVIVSPDGKRSLIVHPGSEFTKTPTYVLIEFPSGSGTIYCTSGIHHDITARWKDNSTIIIQTGKDYLATTQHRVVRSAEDVISVEYVEH